MPPSASHLGWKAWSLCGYLSQPFSGLADPASAGLGDARRSVPWLECGAEKWKLLSPVLKQPRPQQRQYEDFSEFELLLRLRGEAEA